MGYLTAFQVTEALTGLATTFPTLCTLTQLTATVGGNPVNVVALHDPAVQDRIPVLVIGGVHAREWAPPDALIGLATRLLNSRTLNTDIVYPEFISGGVPYSDPNYTIAAADVAKMFDKLELILVPLVNPDGRDFSLLANTSANQLWRKNRRVSPANAACVGVDLNRNFPIAWFHRDFYNPAAAKKAAVSENPCEFEIYKGPGPGSEIETQNIVTLATDRKVQAFVDVHMSGRSITHPWGLERNQEVDATQTFDEAALNHFPNQPTSGRDGLLGTVYGEFIPTQLHQRLRTLANTMSAEILASAGSSPIAKNRSRYAVSQSVDTGILPKETFVGCADDFVFSRQFVDQDMPECVAFTIECGLDAGQRESNPDDSDGGFFPHFTKQFPKIEREIHAGLFGLFRALL